MTFRFTGQCPGCRSRILRQPDVLALNSQLTCQDCGHRDALALFADAATLEAILALNEQVPAR